MSKNKKSEYQKQLEELYQKERKALLQKARRARSRGYTPPEIPKKPKRITEGSIRKLRNLREHLIEKSTYKTETGKIITGKERQKQERQAKAKKGAETRKRKQEERTKQTQQTTQQPAQPPPKPQQPENPVGFADAVINNYMSELSKWEQTNNEKVRKNAGRVANWIESLLEKNEKEQVAIMIEEGAQAGNILTFWVLYDKDLTDEYMTEMIRFFPGMTGQEREEMQKEVAEDEEGYMPVDFDEDDEPLFD